MLKKPQLTVNIQSAAMNKMGFLKIPTLKPKLSVVKAVIAPKNY